MLLRASREATVSMTHFPPFRFDPHHGTLWRGSVEVPLTPKASALLACLLEARGGWVSKAAILAAVWPDTHVQPENVKVLVREIRQALGDSPATPAFIRSLTRRGYAFVAPTIDLPGSAAAGVLSPRSAFHVHRGPELSALTSALPDCSPPLIFVTGGPGVGKTSLCDAFLRTAASGAARVTHGQCFDRESPQEPYYPLLDALLRLDRQYPATLPPLLAEHAPSWLSLFPQWSASRHDRVKDRRGMLEQLSAALTAVARERPLAIVIEDLQWADAETLRALAHVAQSGARVLVIASYSEGAWHAGPDARRSLLAAGPARTTIALTPFSAAQVREYTNARFGPGPIEALAAMVHAATGGNALMVGAAFDSLIERRMIEPGAAGWQRVAPPDAIARVLPEAVAAVVTRQLETLEPREREAIEAAAAVGVEFSLDAVAAVLRWGQQEVDAVLGPLARRGQLIVAGDATNEDALRGSGGRHRFRHACAAEAIARRAPHRRQRAIAGRVQELRDPARRVAT
jgi:DNA-binding winged helix-turn-helix (wHTH) protein/predicted ATPase